MFNLFLKVKFTIACATVDPQTESFDPSPLIPYLKSLDITYHYLSEPIVQLAKEKLQVSNVDLK
jgi:tRNA 2-thiocytidine biosynthesis protein TtcA